MLGILLLYFIWKHYANLAFEHGKTKWKFGLLGIAVYYAGTMVAGFLIGVIGAYAFPRFLDDTNSIAINLICLPFGLLACWGLHRYLKKRWSQEVKTENGEALDSDLIQ